MPRPTKCRRICELPRRERFGPLDGPPEDAVEMTVDEYEVIRLIDLLDYTQEECAAQIGVARTTVQTVYDRARGKLADALVEERQDADDPGRGVRALRPARGPLLRQEL